MFESTLDNYAHSNNLKNVDINFKVLFAILTMLMSLISTSPVIPLFITFLMSFLIIFKAKIPWKFYLKFLMVPFFFGFLTFIFMSIFFGIGVRILELGIFNLAVTEDGFNLGLLIFSRIMGGFTCLAFLTLTTPMNEMFFMFESLKVPKIVIEITMLMYRYIFLFLEEAENMYNSQKTRMGYGNIKNTYKSLGMLSSNLFIRTWLKGEQAYIAMESRCYDGTINSFKTHKNISVKNILLLLSFESFLLLGIYLTWDLKII